MIVSGQQSAVSLICVRQATAHFVPMEIVINCIVHDKKIKDL